MLSYLKDESKQASISLSSKLKNKNKSDDNKNKSNNSNLKTYIRNQIPDITKNYINKEIKGELIESL